MNDLAHQINETKEQHCSVENNKEFSFASFNSLYLVLLAKCNAFQGGNTFAFTSVALLVELISSLMVTVTCF